MDALDPSAQKAIRRLDALAAITDVPGTIQRTFLSPAMARANALVGGWMREGGGEVSVDAWGNLTGHFPGAATQAKTLLLGSHLDTVPNAGKFDGPLGVLVALAALEALRERGVRLPYHVDVLGFSDEEGTRFHSAYLGSSALTGTLTEADLDLRDAGGVSVREAVAEFQGVDDIALAVPRYGGDELLGYVEVHIEQGPVLEKAGVPLGVVDSIAAQTRMVYTLLGKAGHAGTTPMDSRRDALAGAAEIVLAVERLGLETAGLVATVGQLKVEPGASNVIPENVRLSVDIRHQNQDRVDEAGAALARESEEIAARRNLILSHRTMQSTGAVPCDPRLVARLAAAVGGMQGTPPHLTSGAGHDGVILSRLTPFAMLFVRCRDGLSHHPDEHVGPGDIAAAITALARLLEDFA